MLTLGVSGLVTAYVLIALLLLSVNLYSNWSWWIKAGTIVITSAFYLITYFSWPLLLGWPTDAPLPERFRLIAAYVQEPNKLTGAPGEIFLWATDIKGSLSSREPRAYRIEYSTELHEQVNAATTKLRKGLPQLGEVEQQDKSIPLQAWNAAQGSQKSLKIEFYDLPDPLFPEK